MSKIAFRIYLQESGGKNIMNKSKIVFVFFGLIALLVGTIILAKLNKTDQSATNSAITLKDDPDEDVLLSTDEDVPCAYSIEEEDYIVYYQGSAEPEEDDISCQNAAEIGVDYLNDMDYLDLNNNNEIGVYILYTDAFMGIESKWSLKVEVNGQKEYELIINTTTGDVELCLELNSADF